MAKPSWRMATIAAISVAIMASAIAGCGMAENPDPGLADAIRASAARLGVDPYDLGTVISYETAGRLSPDIRGGSGGRHLGYIQFGPSEQQQYGVRPGMTAADQMASVESYLRDRGVKPGMGLLDLYSTVNAGRPGLYNRSDAANGGAPGTVADKVAGMAPHRLRAHLLLDGKLPASIVRPASGVAVAADPGPVPFGLAPAGDDGGASDELIAMAQRYAASLEEEARPRLQPLYITTDPRERVRVRRKGMAL